MKLACICLVCSIFVFAQTRPSPTPTEANPFQSAKGKTILVISPHPDDDIIGCGGALALLSGRGNRVIAVFLTNGERGTLDASAKPDDIGAIRKREAAAAYKQLGYDAELLWLGYPDGELDFAPPRDVRVQLVRIIRSRRPDIVFALDPGATYYRYHYRDHRTAALASADAVGAAMWPLEYTDLGPAYKVPDVYYFYSAEPNLKVDISAVYERKLAALAQHRSQFPPAVEHYSASGPPPSRKDLEAFIEPLTGSVQTETFRHR